MTSKNGPPDSNKVFGYCLSKRIQLVEGAISTLKNFEYFDKSKIKNSQNRKKVKKNKLIIFIQLIVQFKTGCKFQFWSKIGWKYISPNTPHIIFNQVNLLKRLNRLNLVEIFVVRGDRQQATKTTWSDTYWYSILCAQIYKHTKKKLNDEKQSDA